MNGLKNSTRFSNNCQRHTINISNQITNLVCIHYSSNNVYALLDLKLFFKSPQNTIKTIYVSVTGFTLYFSKISIHFKQLRIFKCLYIISIRKIVPNLSEFYLFKRHLNRHYAVSGSIGAFVELYFMRYLMSEKNRINFDVAYYQSVQTNILDLTKSMESDLKRAVVLQ